MERAEIMSQILAILEDVAEISPEDVNENSVMMDDLDLFGDIPQTNQMSLFDFTG